MRSFYPASLSVRGERGAFYLLAPFVPPLRRAHARLGQWPEVGEDRILAHTIPV